jgi:hypothetical protein
MSTELPSLNNTNPEALFAKRLLLRLETQELDHNTTERLRIIRQAALARVPQTQQLAESKTQTQTAQTTVQLGETLGQLNPFGFFSNFGQKGIGTKSLFVLAPIVAVLAYIATNHYFSAQQKDQTAYGIISLVPSSNQASFEGGPHNSKVITTHLMQDPLPPSAYADVAFLEYMDRQIAAQND